MNQGFLTCIIVVAVPFVACNVPLIVLSPLFVRLGHSANHDQGFAV